jgi:Ca-activated chloride channel family protein
MPRLLRTLTFFALALAACEKPSRTRAPDPPPVGAPTDPKLVDLGAALAQRVVQADRAGEVQVRLRVDTARMKLGARPPIHVVLVMDTSGSMTGAAIADARAAARALVDGLAPGDRLAIVTFDSQARVLVPSTTIDRRARAGIAARIDGIAATGTTDLAGGLALALAEARGGYLQDGVNRVVLLSDGVPNDPAPIAALAQQAAAMRMPVTALGLGLEYDETLLAALAGQSGGKFHFIEDSAAVAQVFKQEVLRLERVVAKSLQLELQPGPGVAIAGVIGHPHATPTGRGVSVPLGDLADGGHRDVVVRLTVGPHRDGAAVELLDAVLRFQDAVAGAGALERRAFVAAEASADRARVAAGRDPDVERAVRRALADAATLDAIALARAGQLTAADELLVRAEPEARGAAAQLRDADLAAQADGMVELRKALPTLGPAPASAPAAQPSALELAAPAPEARDRTTVKRSHHQATARLQGG